MTSILDAVSVIFSEDSVIDWAIKNRWKIEGLGVLSSSPSASFARFSYTDFAGSCICYDKSALPARVLEPLTWSLI